MSSRTLLALDAALEIPECGCRPLLIPLCLYGRLANGCTPRQEKGACDCPLLPGPACPHVLAAVHGLDLEAWARLRERAHPDDFRQPPRPTTPTFATSRAERLRLMEQRQALGLALYHPAESGLALLRADFVSEQGHTTPNGSTCRDGAIIANRKKERPCLLTLSI